MLYFLIGGVFVMGIGVALYEGRRKRTLLAHDLRQQPRPDPHTNAATMQAQDAIAHQINGLGR